MNKFLLTVSALIASCTLSTMNARAGNETHFESLKPYIGFDLQLTSLEYTDNFNLGGGLALDGDAILEDQFYGGKIHVGIRPSKRLGLELGYFRTLEEDKDIAAGTLVGPGTVAATAFSTDFLLQGITLDAMSYWPLGSEERFELIGSAGVSWTIADFALNVPGSTRSEVDESEFGLRAGLGAQAHINDRLNIRGLAQYQTADFDGLIDNMWVYSLGMNYKLQKNQ